jgi:ABC-type nitrate/sulfonate/bicarbonate transport system permease component
LEIAISNIIIAAIVGELLGTVKGLGFVIVMSVSQYKFPLLMAAVVVTTVVSILLTSLFRALTKIIFKVWL